MKREKKLIKNVLIFAIGTFGTKFLSFILLPLYTYYLSTKEYGFFDLITTTITLVIPIITIMLDNGVYRFLLDSNDENTKKEIISTSFFTVMTNLLVSSILFIVIFNTYLDLNFKYAILFQIIFTIISNMFLQIVRGLRRNIIYSINGVLVTLVTIITNIICLKYFKFGVGSLIYSNIFANIVSIIYLTYKVKIFTYLKFNLINKVLNRNMIKYSIPLIPNAISWWVMNVSDRFIINKYMDVSANGIYAIANKLPAILTLVNFVFYLAWQESAITSYKSKDKNVFYTNMFQNYMKIQFGSIIMLLGFTHLILKFMIDPKFYEAYKYIPFLYIGTLFYSFSSFYGVFYDSSKNTIGSSITSIVGALFNIMFNIIMLPKYGLQAASISTAVSFFIMWIIRVINTKKYVTVKLNYTILSICFIFLTVFTILYYSTNQIIHLLLMITSVIIFSILNKKLILQFYKLFKQKKINVPIK